MHPHVESSLQTAFNASSNRLTQNLNDLVNAIYYPELNYTGL